MRIQVASICPLMKLSDIASNLRTLARWTQSTAQKGADLAMFPETFITGYATENMYKAGFAEKKIFLALAESVPGPIVKRVAEISGDYRIHICAGMLERQGDDFYNTQILTGPKGYIGKYRKVQVASTESWFSKPGEEFPVFSIRGVPTGIMLCRDKSYPEVARILALEGAQLLLNPHCTPQSPKQSFTSWSLKLCTTRAMENGCFLIANNPVFDCPVNKNTQAGFSFAIDPYGNIIHCDTGPGNTAKMAIITVDTEIVKQRRRMEGKDFNLWSRTPRVYKRLVQEDKKLSHGQRSS